MFCDECGYKNKENAKFCKKCGTSLTEENLKKKKNVEEVLEKEFDSSQDDMQLNKKQLLEYLNMGKELEINKLGLENSITELHNLDKKKHDEIVKPLEKKKRPTLKEIKNNSSKGVKSLFDILVGIGGTLFIPLYIVVMALAWRFGPSEWQKGFTLFLIPIGIIVGIYIVLAVWVYIIRFIIGNTLGTKKYKKEIEKYEKDSAIIDSENQSQLLKYDEQKNIINGRIDDINTDLTDVTKTLGKYYDLDVIYPKYRNLIAITTFIEYLESGRCKSLYGYTGCYNVYEQELRQNTIIGKLDQVLIQLDQIKKIQFATYLAIEKSNALQSAMLNTCNEMLDETKRANATLEAQSQDTKIIKRNSEIVSTISALNYIKK